jgi:hypothetical protein
MVKPVITILLLIVSLGDQTVTPQQMAENNEPTRFELSAEKITYYVGEPVELVMTLHNNRERPIQGDLYLDFQNVWIYHRKVGGEFVRYFPRWVQHWGSVVDYVSFPITIPAHGKLERKFNFFYNTYYKQLVLPEAGQYEFKATFGGPRPILEANIVRITAVELPELEQAALVLLRDPELAQLIEGDFRPGVVEDKEVEAGADKAAAFVRKHGQSRYASLVKDKLAFVLKEAAQKGKLTPKLKALQAALPNLQ